VATGAGPDDYDPIHHVPHTPVVLALALSAMFVWLYVRYEQATTSAGLVGLALAAASVVLTIVMRRAPGPRVLALLVMSGAQLGWYVIAVA
jgi:hypothetical protein